MAKITNPFANNLYLFNTDLKEARSRQRNAARTVYGSSLSNNELRKLNADTIGQTVMGTINMPGMDELRSATASAQSLYDQVKSEMDLDAQRLSERTGRKTTGFGIRTAMGFGSRSPRPRQEYSVARKTLLGA